MAGAQLQLQALLHHHDECMSRHRWDVWVFTHSVFSLARSAKAAGTGPSKALKARLRSVMLLRALTAAGSVPLSLLLFTLSRFKLVAEASTADGSVPCWTSTTAQQQLC
jgi:hypothetical protein